MELISVPTTQSFWVSDSLLGSFAVVCFGFRQTLSVSSGDSHDLESPGMVLYGPKKIVETLKHPLRPKTTEWKLGLKPDFYSRISLGASEIFGHQI